MTHYHKMALLFAGALSTLTVLLWSQLLLSWIPNRNWMVPIILFFLLGTVARAHLRSRRLVLLSLFVPILVSASGAWGLDWLLRWGSVSILLPSLLLGMQLPFTHTAHSSYWVASGMAMSALFQILFNIEAHSLIYLGGLYLLHNFFYQYQTNPNKRFVAQGALTFGILVVIFIISRSGGLLPSQTLSMGY